MQIRTTDLDRDRLQDSYNIEIFAYDSGSPRNSANTIVTVNIKDINDKAPMFDTSTLSDIEVSEAAIIGSHRKYIVCLIFVSA